MFHNRGNFKRVRWLKHDLALVLAFFIVWGAGAGCGVCLNRPIAGLTIGLLLGVGGVTAAAWRLELRDPPSRSRQSRKDILDKLSVYIDGKMRRYTLLFGVNGGAFAIAQLMTDPSKRFPGRLTLPSLATGAVMFTAAVTLDIWQWGQSMRYDFVGEKAFTPTGKAILLLIGGLISSGWFLAALPSDSMSQPSAEHWKLIWSDEFDKDGKPDPRNWAYETGFIRNHELQWYQPNNAWCRNGLLTIEGRRERKRNPGYEPNSTEWQKSRQYADYTSACLTTQGLHSWRYGRIEMRAKIDTRPGLWPAFWTLGVEGEWPSGGEIDIMEYYQGTLLANVAWGTEKRWVPRWDSSRKPITEFNDPDWSRKFHVWRMDWDETGIRLSVDDLLLNSTDLAETFNKDQKGKNPFRQPQFLLLNLAIGGESGGDPSKTEFPARFEVDYVRVYQKQA